MRRFRKPKESRQIVLSAPQVFGSPGGIQTYMRLVARALTRNTWLGKVISLQDVPNGLEDRNIDYVGAEEFIGCGGSKPKFIAHNFANTRSTDFVLFGHVGLSPVGALLERFGVISGFGVILHGVEAWERLPIHQRLALQAADIVLCTTPFTADQVARKNELDRDNIEMLPLAVEPGRFDTEWSRDHRAIADGEPIRVLSVGRIASSERYKGFEHVIEALGILASRGVKATYRLVGDGDDVGRLRALAREAGVEDRVSFLGRVTDAELRNEFNNAHVFAMPSRGEGFGLVYLEAMHYGLPVIASPEGGAQHVVEHRSDGMLVEYGAPESLADSLHELRTLELRKKLGAKGRENIENKFSFARFEQEVQGIVGRHVCVE